jgi:hypothetical protein
MTRNVGRPPKPENERAKNAGFVAYPVEIKAIKAAARNLNLKSGFDYVRRLVIDADHPAIRGKISSPRKLSSPS